MKDEIKREADSIHRKLIAIRRDLHEHPELAYEEKRTASVVAKTLKSLGLRVRTGIAKTGVVAALKGKSPGAVIALRADLDALPITEQNDVPYRSKTSGKMHACGHDVHTANVIGAAIILSRIKDAFDGSVLFVFEPSEERNPGGASLMLKEGALAGVDAIFGLHVYTRSKAGTLGFRSGPMMAAADELEITVKGKGGHGARPQATVDPIVVASQVVLALQTVVSRGVNPLHPVVLTIGKIQGGSAQNVIPDDVQLVGTLRTTDSNTRERTHKLIRRTVAGVCSSAGASFHLVISRGNPPLINDPMETDFARGRAEEYVGSRNVFEADQVMGGESFAYFLEKIPGTFFRLGVVNRRKGFVHDVHTPWFDVDEEAIRVGSGFFAYLAYEYLKRPRGR
ncbi:MAG TPA: amidohydrolase [Bacteroidota bacterium]